MKIKGLYDGEVLQNEICDVDELQAYRGNYSGGGRQQIECYNVGGEPLLTRIAAESHITQ